MKFLVLLLFTFSGVLSADELKRAGRQFSQIYQPGSISTNVNNALQYPGSFNGQQNYGAGSLANNFALGKKKRDAQFSQVYQHGSISTNVNNALQYPGSFNGQQNFHAGSQANNFALGKKKREAQFSQIYQHGSISTNVNNAVQYPGSFNGQQNYGAGSAATNIAFGKKKREAQFSQIYQHDSLSTNVNSIVPTIAHGIAPGFGAGLGSVINQDYNLGSSATNIGRKKRQFNQNYFPGSVSTNINNPIGVPGFGFPGGFGKKKRDISKRAAQLGFGVPGFGSPGFGAGFGSTINQNYGFGSTATNFGRKKRQFNQNYFPGSVSTNINNPIGVPGFGGFPGGFGKKKREAASAEVVKREAQFGGIFPGAGAGFGAGYGSVINQGYGFGSHATNFGKK